MQSTKKLGLLMRSARYEALHTTETPCAGHPC